MKVIDDLVVSVGYWNKEGISVMVSKGWKRQNMSLQSLSTAGCWR